ncbi:hypothetical protein HaLaN_20080, partial [Haematococcus lacustris]
GHSGAGHELYTQAQRGREGSDPTCPARCSWVRSVAAVSRDEARMSKTGMNLYVSEPPRILWACPTYISSQTRRNPSSM